MLEVAGAAHPVPFNAAVNQFVLQSLHLPAAPQIKPESVREVVVPLHMQLDMPLDIPLETSEPVTEPEPAPHVHHHHASKPRASLLGLLKQLLGATKK